jgi:hypothetical protein
MTQRTRTLLFLMVAAVALSGCYYDVEEELYPTSCTGIDPSWSVSVAPLVAQRCSGSSCHNAGSENGEIATYAQVKALVDNGKFRNRVLVLQDMPLGSSLDRCQLDMLKAWVDAGAPNN